MIIDWVPAHFPTDAHGLGRFDGTALYEHAGSAARLPPRLEHADLQFRTDRGARTSWSPTLSTGWTASISTRSGSMRWHRCSISTIRARPGEWIPNVHGGRENLEAIAFLREMNTLIFGEHPGATTIAEESTAWPQVSRPVDGGGLGFGFKWNMGWMHDTLEYMKLEPVHREYHHHQMTFGLHYAFSENFVLPLSHDEVVHGKGSLIGKMPGDRWQKFANLRAYFAFMWTHPGKKLLFMGGEFAQEARVEPRPLARLAPACRAGTPPDAGPGPRSQPALPRAAGTARARLPSRRGSSGLTWAMPRTASTASCVPATTAMRRCSWSATSRRWCARASGSGCRWPGAGSSGSTPTPRSMAAPTSAIRAASRPKRWPGTVRSSH